jgi:FMN-dependent NADH-azoreductase
MPTVKIHNAETNEIIEREMNEEELAQFKKDLAAAQTKIEAANQAQSAKTALLEKLGITEDEAKLLLS